MHCLAGSEFVGELKMIGLDLQTDSWIEASEELAAGVNSEIHLEAVKMLCKHLGVDLKL